MRYFFHSCMIFDNQEYFTDEKMYQIADLKTISIEFSQI